MTPAGGAPVIEVLDGGLLTTIQDAGRPAALPLGVPEGGASDRWSLALANVRCGNPWDAPVLELTLVAPRLRFLRATRIALAGADLRVRIRGPGGDRELQPGAAVWVAEDDVLEPRDGPPDGCRACLAIAGGFHASIVLGSASTALAAGFGGNDGRALRAGDVLHAAPAEPSETISRLGPLATDGADDPPATRAEAIGLLPGPHGDRLADTLAALVTASWRVAATSDRMGIRLDGPSIPTTGFGELASHGVVWGSVQLPPDGRPIVLLADHQPTGGYPVPAVVPVADHPRLAQLRPGDPVRFDRVTRDDAIAALQRQRAALHAFARAMRDARAWDDAVLGATG